MNIERIAAFMERQDMLGESYRHDVQRMFDEMSKEHLLTLRIMLNQFSSENDLRLTSYYEGVVAATLALRFDVCGGCGKNHDEELLKNEKTEVTDLVTDFVTNEVPLSTEQLDQMTTYHLDDLRDEDSGQLLGFTCTLCGLRYVSIEDRMLKSPDNCHGCYLKSAHG